MIKSAILATLSLIHLVAAGSAVEVIPVYTTTYPNSQATATADPQAAYAANNYAATTTTPAPAATQTYDIYSAMPYTSMTAGGYKQLGCGYGWYKNSQGQCMKENWVSDRPGKETRASTSTSHFRVTWMLIRSFLRHVSVQL